MLKLTVLVVVVLGICWWHFTNSLVFRGAYACSRAKVSIVADMFMNSIEEITSRSKQAAAMPLQDSASCQLGFYTEFNGCRVWLVSASKG